MTSGYFGANEFSDAAYVSKGTGKRGRIAADTNFSPFDRARNICCRHKFCVRDTKNVSDFVQKHFVSATNVSQFAQPKKHHEQQCGRNNVSSFATPPPPPTHTHTHTHRKKKSSLVANNVISFIHVLFFECCQAL